MHILIQMNRDAKECHCTHTIKQLVSGLHCIDTALSARSSLWKQVNAP